MMGGEGRGETEPMNLLGSLEVGKCEVKGGELEWCGIEGRI